MFLLKTLQKSLIFASFGVSLECFTSKSVTRNISYLVNMETHLFMGMQHRPLRDRGQGHFSNLTCDLGLKIISDIRQINF